MRLKIGDRVAWHNHKLGVDVPHYAPMRRGVHLDLGTVIRREKQLLVVWDRDLEVDPVDPDGILHWRRDSCSRVLLSWGTRNATAAQRAQRAAKAEGRLRAIERRLP